ncbi:MAG: hypothetical protein R3A78_11340 [Polyangiales bacterium]
MLAVELLVASQGIDFRAPLRPGRGVAAVHAAVRESVATLTEDRPLHRDMEVCAALLHDGHRGSRGPVRRRRALLNGGASPSREARSNPGGGPSSGGRRRQRGRRGNCSAPRTGLRSP